MEEFSRSLKTRLLQPGANTSEILDIYVSTIKVGVVCSSCRGAVKASSRAEQVFVLVGLQAFRIIDPKGVMLEALSGSVKEVRIRVWVAL